MASIEIAPDRTRIGWIGLGVMGAPMCGHLLDAGYSTTVYTRTASRADALLARGARWAADPAEVAAQSDVVFTIVGHPHDVRSVILGSRGVLENLAAGGIVVDMTTSAPALAMEIDEKARARGCAAVDAPVSGGDIGAREARLSIMVGGEPEVVRGLRPCFETMGRTIVHQGPAGAGQHTKMVNQILIASSMVGICEALLYGRRAGLDMSTVLESISSGAASSWALSNLAPRILEGDFAPGFFIEHFVKDLGIALAESERLALSLPGLALARQLYLAAVAQGHARSGTQALQLALARLSGGEWPGQAAEG